MKNSLRAKVGAPKTLVKRKLRPHSLYFPQNSLTLTESSGEFSDLHSVFLRWPTSALRMPNDTPNSKLYSEFLNLTPNSKTSLRIQKHHSEFTKLTPNSKTSLRIQKSHSEFLNLTPNSKTSLRIPKHHSEFKKTHSEFKNLTPNSKTSLRIRKTHSEFLNRSV